MQQVWLDEFCVEHETSHKTGACYTGAATKPKLKTFLGKLKSRRKKIWENGYPY